VRECRHAGVRAGAVRRVTDEVVAVAAVAVVAVVNVVVVVVVVVAVVDVIVIVVIVDGVVLFVVTIEKEWQGTRGMCLCPYAFVCLCFCF
jgi:hypothetical protein